MVRRNIYSVCAALLAAATLVTVLGAIAGATASATHGAMANTALARRTNHTAHVSMHDVRESTENALAKALETIEGTYYEYLEDGGRSPSSCEPLSNACDDWPASTFENDPLFPTGKGVTFDTAFSLNAETRTHEEKVAACAVDAVETTWTTSYDDTEPFGKWQYMATQSDGGFHMFPGPEDLDLCGTAYDPRGRWWYSMTTPKNLGIVVPWSTVISDDARERSKTAALDVILETLTYLDHAFVLLYGDNEHYFMTETLPVNATVRQSFASLFDAIPPFSSDGNDVVTNNFIEAAQLAVERMRISEADGATSECKSAILLFTAGDIDGSVSPNTDMLRLTNSRSSFGEADPDAEDYNEDDAVYYPILTYMIGQSKNEYFIKAIACENAGTFVHIPDSVRLDDMIEYVVTYIEFFSAAITADKTQLRWSEPYVDALGLGTVMSACIPFFLREDANSIFLGVTCIDVKIDDVATAPDFGHVYENSTDSMVANSRICPEARYGGQALENVRDSLARFGDNSCLDKKTVGGGHDQLSTGERVGIYFAGLLFSTCLGAWMSTKMSKKQADQDWFHLFAAVVVCYTIGTCLFLFITYPEIVDNANLVKTTCDIERVYDDPYRCCDIVNCVCQNCNRGVDPSCSQRLGELTEGPCCKGYHCCRETCCRTCTRCTSTKYGSSCSSYCCGHCCVESVNHRLCQSSCGTCHHLFTDVKVHIHGELFGYTQVGHCGRDKHSCVTAWYDQWNEGESRTCFYDKTTVPVGNRAGKVALRVTFKEPEYDYAAITFVAIFWFVFLCIYLFYTYQICPSMPCRRRSRQGGDHHRVTPMQTMHTGGGGPQIASPDDYPIA